MTEQEWVLETIKFYRPMDFFNEYSGLTDEQLADSLIAHNAQSDGQDYLQMYFEAKDEAAQEHEEWEIVGPEAIADMVLVSGDNNRVWWNDGETDIFPEGKIYITFLQECSRISRGSFLIENIEEQWQQGKLESVDFDWKDERWQIFPSDMYGWIDFEILQQINALIRESGYQIFTHWVGDQTTFIVVLTAEEKQKFESERNWSFNEA